MMPRKILAVLGVLIAVPSHTGAQQDQTADRAVADFQTDFAAAYNRGDVDAMAASFTEKDIRVMPAGIFISGAGCNPPQFPRCAPVRIA
jgi:hypothetical protein